MTDRFDVFTSSGPASHDLAFEAEMLDRAADGRCTLVVASWRGPVAVLGYSQPQDDVDLDLCRERRIPVLRRLSGGTGVIHRSDLSLSLALPVAHPWAASVVGLYDRFLAHGSTMPRLFPAATATSSYAEGGDRRSAAVAASEEGVLG